MKSPCLYFRHLRRLPELFYFIALSSRRPFIHSISPFARVEPGGEVDRNSSTDLG